MRSLTRAATSIAILLSVAASCKKAAPPPEPPAPPPPPPPVAVASLDLGKSVGSDFRVPSPLVVFGVRDTVYASVATTGVSTSATLTAKWTFQTGQTVDSTTRSIAPTGPAVTEFHIMKKTAWPAGKYKVAIMLNGTPTLEREFEIKR